MREKEISAEESELINEQIQLLEDILGPIDYDNEEQVKQMKQMLIYALSLYMGRDKTKEFLSDLNKKLFKNEYNMLRELLKKEGIELKKLC